MGAYKVWYVRQTANILIAELTSSVSSRLPLKFVCSEAYKSFRCYRLEKPAPFHFVQHDQAFSCALALQIFKHLTCACQQRPFPSSYTVSTPFGNAFGTWEL